MMGVHVDSDSEERRRAALGLTDAAWVPRGLSAPPIYRLLWACGVRAVPPHFASIASVLAVVFAANLLVWGLPAMAVARFSRSSVVNAVVGSAAFAVAAAGYFRWSARRHGLEAWQARVTAGRPARK